MDTYYLMHDEMTGEEHSAKSVSEPQRIQGVANNETVGSNWRC